MSCATLAHAIVVAKICSLISVSTNCLGGLTDSCTFSFLFCCEVNWCCLLLSPSYSFYRDIYSHNDFMSSPKSVNWRNFSNAFRMSLLQLLRFSYFSYPWQPKSGKSWAIDSSHLPLTPTRLRDIIPSQGCPLPVVREIMGLHDWRFVDFRSTYFPEGILM